MTGESFNLFSTTQTTSEKCHNRAPYLYIRNGNNAVIIQACCNDWTCPRCGIQRAKTEYARIVNGTKEIYEKGRAAYFYTLTCRGSELSVEDAESGYMGWCNRVLTSMRTKCKRAGQGWEYAIVTERQTRGHPHSHALITWIPDDTIMADEGALLDTRLYARRDRLWSDWLHQRITDAGLGEQWDLSVVENPDAVSRYIAKYLFKSGMKEVWPKGWRRVRYSHSWPKLPDNEPPEEAFPLAKKVDWMRVKHTSVMVKTPDKEILAAAKARGVNNVIFG